VGVADMKVGDNTGDTKLGIGGDIVDVVETEESICG